MESITLAILITQIPISIAILIAVYELHKTKEQLIEILNKLSKK